MVNIKYIVLSVEWCKNLCLQMEPVSLRILRGKSFSRNACRSNGGAVRTPLLGNCSMDAKRHAVQASVNNLAS